MNLMEKSLCLGANPVTILPIHGAGLAPAPMILRPRPSLHLLCDLEQTSHPLWAQLAQMQNEGIWQREAI